MIRVLNIFKRYGTVPALCGVSFHVRKGETFGIIGPNGAGKSTVLKILLGLVHPDQGSVVVNDIDLRDHGINARKLIGYVPQKDGFDEQATGRQSLEFLARLRGVHPSRVDEYARLVDVDDLLPRPVGTLSGGQRQKLSLAAALLGDPRVLLLDEPTASLDPRATAGFRQLVERLAGEERTIVLCSHLLSDVERLCDRVLILLDGKVEAVETNGGDLPHELLIDVDNTARVRKILSPFGDRTLWMNGSGLCARLDGQDQIRLLGMLDQEGVHVRSFETKRPSLEERFLKAVRTEENENPD